MVAANYRLSPHVKAPAYIKDAGTAVAWTFRHIAKYGGATHRIFVSGHSAGGYLTGMIGLDKRWLAGHPDAELRELEEFDHGQMAEPAHALLLEFIKSHSHPADPPASPAEQAAVAAAPQPSLPLPVNDAALREFLDCQLVPQLGNAWDYTFAPGKFPAVEWDRPELVERVMRSFPLRVRGFDAEGREVMSAELLRPITTESNWGRDMAQRIDCSPSSALVELVVTDDLRTDANASLVLEGLQLFHHRDNAVSPIAPHLLFPVNPSALRIEAYQVNPDAGPLRF